MLLISHNLAIVEEFCDEVVVLLHGRIVEQGPIDEVFAAPRDDYA